jgi:hypothetical protein
MPERTTQSSVTFLHPFLLVGLDGVQPAGTYTIETIEETLDDLSFVAYRRVSTNIIAPAVGTVTLQRQVVTIDPQDLEAAQRRDAETT